MQVGAAVVGHDVCPARRLLEPPEVGLEPAAERVEGGRLADAVAAEDAEHVAGARGRQPVQLERVEPVLVRDVRREVRRHVDDAQRPAGAALGAVEAGEARVLHDRDWEGRRASDGDALLARRALGDPLQEVVRRHAYIHTKTPAHGVQPIATRPNLALRMPGLHFS